MMQTQVNTAFSHEDEDHYVFMAINAQSVSSFTEVLRPLITSQKNMPFMLYTYDQAMEMATEGRMQLFVAKKAEEQWPCLFFLTEMEEYPAGRVLRICLAAGKDLWPVTRRYWPAFVNWALNNGADFIEADTKKPIMRILRRLNFIPTSVKMQLPLKRMN